MITAVVVNIGVSVLSGYQSVRAPSGPKLWAWTSVFITSSMLLALMAATMVGL